VAPSHLHKSVPQSERSLLYTQGNDPNNKEVTTAHSATKESERSFLIKYFLHALASGLDGLGLAPRPRERLLVRQGVTPVIGLNRAPP